MALEDGNRNNNALYVSKYLDERILNIFTVKK
jgi:hypothetical protein